jgi:predicted Zn-dependent peptidase
MFKRLVRRDGSVIIFLPKKDTKAVTLEVLYKIGSQHENKSQAGVSHFVEHLMFKGTKNRPKTIDISKELDSVGAEYNAFTGKEYTGYYITADSSHLPLASEILSDILHNSKFDPLEVDKERGVILEEMKMYEDNPMLYIEDIFENLLYQGTPLGNQIIGSRQSIKTVKRDLLYDYYQKNYQRHSMVIGLAGSFKETEALKLINKFFPIAKSGRRVSQKKLGSFKQAKPRLTIVKRELEQVQLALGFRSVASTHPKFLVGQILSNALGGMWSSRLFLEIREKRGLCYFINASLNGYKDVSGLVIQAGLNKAKIYEALGAIKEELEKVRTKGITEVELKKAKDNIKGRLILRLENASTHLSFLLSQEIIDEEIKDLEAKLKELEKINLSQVNKMAREIIKWSQSNLAIIGPFQSKDKFLKILSAQGGLTNNY